MKKVISLALGLVFILSCMVLPVSAVTPSPEIQDIIISVEGTDAKGNGFDIRLEETDKIDEDLKPQGSGEKVITQANVIVTGTPEYPVTLKVTMAGVKSTSNVYVLAKDANGKVTKIPVKVLSDGVISFVMDKYYASVSFIADIETATQIGTSDKTGDVTVPAVAMVMLASAAAIVFAKKKVEEN